MKIIKEEVGKQASKRKIYTLQYEEGDKPSANDLQNLPKTPSIAEEIESAHAWAIHTLRSSGLPETPTVNINKQSGKRVQVGTFLLDEYVLKRGHQYDSPEWFAAKIVCMLHKGGTVDPFSYQLGAIIRLGLGYENARKNYSNRGQKGADSKWGERAHINKLITSLANMRDELGDPLPPKELWGEFYCRLEELGLKPQDESGENIRDKDRMRWDGNLKGMTYKTFENRVTAARTKK